MSLDCAAYIVEGGATSYRDDRWSAIDKMMMTREEAERRFSLASDADGAVAVILVDQWAHYTLQWYIAPARRPGGAAAVAASARRCVLRALHHHYSAQIRQSRHGLCQGKLAYGG